MRCAGALAIAGLAALAVPARAPGADPAAPGTGAAPGATPAAIAPPSDGGRRGGEVYAGGTVGSFHGVGMRLLDLRLGLGRRLAGQRLFGLTGAELGVLLTARGQLGSTEHGLGVRSGRIGGGVRVRSGRVTVGLDADAVLLVVDRASTSGHLTGTGWGAGAGLAVDLFRAGPAGTSALFVGIDGTLTMIGASDDPWLYAASAGLGFRW